MLKSVPGTNKY